MKSHMAQMMETLELVGKLLEEKDQREALVHGEWMAAAGVLAGSVGNDLAKPLARVKELLGHLVETLDHHIAHARGPKPLPWQLVGDFRKQLAEAFLDVGQAARLAGDLVAVASTPPTTPVSTLEALDVNQIVERAVMLTRHRLVDGCDVFVNLSRVPAARGDLARFTQAVTQLLFGSAYVCGPSGISVGTGHEADDVVIRFQYVATDKAFPFHKLIHHAVHSQGGRFHLAHTPGSASLAEIRLSATT